MQIARSFQGIPLDPTPHRDVIGLQARRDGAAIFCPRGIEFLSSQMRKPGRSFSPLVITRLSGGPSSIDQQRPAGGKFRCVGSKVKDGSRDFFAGAEPTHGMQR